MSKSSAQPVGEDFSELGSFAAGDGPGPARFLHSRRVSWWNVAATRGGYASVVVPFIAASVIGLRMSFSDAMTAIGVAIVLSAVLASCVGVAGQKERLPTWALLRWSGFGLKGAAMVSLAAAGVLVFWFAVHIEVLGRVVAALAQVPVWAAVLASGACLTLLVVFGNKLLTWPSLLAIVLFSAPVGWLLWQELHNGNWESLMPPSFVGTTMTVASAVTVAMGSYIMAAVLSADTARQFTRPSGAVWATIIRSVLTFAATAVPAVLLMHTIKVLVPRNDVELVVLVLTSGLGTIALSVLAASMLRAGSSELAPAALSTTQAARVLTGAQVKETPVAILLGIIATGFAVVGVGTHVMAVLVFAGVVFPPIVGIMVVDYFWLRSWRESLADSAEADMLPSFCPDWIPASLIAWFMGVAAGSPYMFGGAIMNFFPVSGTSVVSAVLAAPAVHAAVVAMVVYLVFGTLGLNRPKRPMVIDLRHLVIEDQPSSVDESKSTS